MTTENKIVVILGLDAAKKPHAARFDLSQADAVRKAAGLMGFRTGLPETEEAQKLCAKLAVGKLFAAGRGLVPLVKAALFEELAKALVLEEAQPAPNASAAPDKPAAVPAPITWENLRVGSVIIAPERDAANDGWWPGVITAVSKDGQKITIRWRDQPKQPAVTLKRHAVALLNHS
jgi:hypothetical protein